MTNEELGSLALALLLLLGSAQLLGMLATRLRQPKVIGEILAGILLGPTLFGHFAPGVAAGIFGDGPKDVRSIGLAFVYNLGLLLLMFVSGSAVRNVLGKENRRQTLWILGVGAPLPFVLFIGIGALLPLTTLIGSAGSKPATVLILATAAAVCSIPVITKIFSDLGILHTRFASLLLGAAVLEDVLLWGVVSVATAIAAATVSADGGSLTTTIATHVAVNLAYVFVAMAFMPRVLRYLGRARWNQIAIQAPVAWMLIVMFAYVALAAVLDVTLVFGAFLAGFGLVGGMSGSERERIRQPVNAIAAVSGGLFIPLYFAIVGFKLDLTGTFSLWMFLAFLVATSVVRIASVGLGAHLAGFRGLGRTNLAVTANARGGPCIVLATVAFDAHIISASFFTTLVLTAVVTSQISGAWLDHVLRKGWSLLGDAGEQAVEPAVDSAAAAATATSTNAAGPDALAISSNEG